MRKRLEVVDELLAAVEQDPRSPETIGLRAGLSRATLRKWLNGETSNPRVDTLDKVARVLGRQLAFIDGHWSLAPIQPVRARPRMALWRWK